MTKRVLHQISQLFVDFDVLTGYPVRLAQETEDYARPGLDGHAARITGKRGAPFLLRAVKFTADNAAAETLVSGLLDWQGYLVDVWDEWGQLQKNVKLDRVTWETPELGPKKLVFHNGAAKVRVGLLLACHKIYKSVDET